MSWSGCVACNVTPSWRSRWRTCSEWKVKLLGYTERAVAVPLGLHFIAA